LSGAAAFTATDAAALHCLTASPRASIHAALTDPAAVLHAAAQHAQQGAAAAVTGFNADMEDACLAYQLLDQDPGCVNVADWLSAFVDVHVKGKGQGKGRGKGKRRRGGSSSAGDEDGEEGVGVGEPSRLEELAARFSQATAELQFVGLIKPAKRRRGDCVARLVHMPARGF
jgi:hypothetical protein